LDPEKTKEITNLILCWLREEIFKDPTSQIAIIGASMIAKAKAGEDGLLRGAPHAVIAVVPKDHMWPEDASIALTYLELAAHAIGVGACWGGFLTSAVRNFKGLREYLGIGEDEHVCGAQMIGYPAIKPTRQFPPRREPDIEWIGQRKDDR
jgi:nitroreductase